MLTLFAAVNQSFFMALFFAIAAYFTPPAFAAKGARVFLRDRLARLGLPLLAYVFLVNPVVVYVARRAQGEAAGGFAAFLAHDGARAFGTGPLWFVLALLLFSFAYAASRAWRSSQGAAAPVRSFPDDRHIFVFTIGMGLAAFAVRLVFPVGWNVLGLQLGYFPLYIAFFVLGVRARASGWLGQLEARQARRWFRAALIAIVAMPALMLAAWLAGGEEGFRGGLTIQSLLYSLWEPLLCVGISLRLLVLFRERYAQSPPLAKRAARSAYAAYIIHPLIVVPLTAVIAGVAGGPLAHFLLLCLLAVSASFVAADVVRRAPGLSRIL